MYVKQFETWNVKCIPHIKLAH